MSKLLFLHGENHEDERALLRK